jgi:heat shock protein HslJ
MLKRFLTVLVAASVLGGCTSSATEQLDKGDLDGVWILETFDDQRVDVDMNSAGTPWIRIDGTIEGSGGCNDFTMNSFELDDSQLKPGETFSTLVGCLTDDPAHDLMAAETALLAVLGEDSIAVEIAGSTMTWRTSGSELSFIRADSRPDQ